MSETVFLSYDRSALDAQLNNRARVPGYLECFARWRAWSDEARSQLRCELDIPYGPSPAERLDIFPVDASPAPMYVFMHGGWWSSLDKSDNRFVAAGMVPNGAMTVLVNYGLAPAHDMDEIVRQIRAALAWLHEHAAEYGGDPERIYVAGHSAGGHLAAMLAATDWPAANVPPDPIKGVCAISGIFDLEPIRLSYHNDTLHLSEEQAARNSPLGRPVPRSTRFAVVLGAEESDEFHRQSRVYHDTLTAAGSSSMLVAPPGLNHFDVIDQLRFPDSELVRLQLAEMSSVLG